MFLKRLVKDAVCKGRIIGYFENSIRIFYQQELRSCAELFGFLTPAVFTKCLIRKELHATGDILCLYQLNQPPTVLELFVNPHHSFRLAASVSLSTSAALFLGPLACALPTGYQSAAGDVQFSKSGSTLNVTTGANRSIANYQSFNIGQGETVNFNLPGAQAAILNRVTGENPSEILGSMKSNGQVFVVNPSGIVFGQSAQVNVGSLFASTLDISDSDFLNGQYTFRQKAGAAPASVVNQGSIRTAGGGFAVLSGAAVENSGTVTAPNGDIALVVGEQMTLSVDNNLGISITVDEALKNEVESLEAAIRNSGTLRADNGSVTLQARMSQALYERAVNNEGIIEAKGFGGKGGEIALISDALITHSGTMNVSGTAAGGRITLSSEEEITMSGNLLASGGTTGGVIELSAGGILDLSNRMDATGGTFGGNISLHSDVKIMATAGQIADVNGARAGKILNDAPGTFSSGQYFAVSSDGVGGKIDFGGSTAFLSAVVDASGSEGGGRIRVGGEFQGGKHLPAGTDELRNSANVAISEGTKLMAKTTGLHGAGGEVIVWSDGTTHFYGNIDVRPGSASGTGGFVEVSGTDLNITQGNILTGMSGRPGEILLDPKNLYIQDTTVSGLAMVKLAYQTANDPSTGRFILNDNDYFGLGVALNGAGDILAVGALGDDTGGSARGAVYLFNLNTSDLTHAPTFRYKLAHGSSGLSLANSDHFGIALALNDTGDILAVGAPGDTSNRGSVHLFNLDPANLTQAPTWRYELANGSPGLPALASGDRFGTAVALNGAGDIMAVGTDGDDADAGGGTDRGSVYLLNLDTADLTQAPTYQYKLEDSHPGFGLNNSDFFGISVALNGAGDILAVGAHQDDTGTGDNLGAVYLFSLDPLNLSADPEFKHKLDDDHSVLSLAAGDAFGRGVALNDSGSILAVGAEGDDTGGAGSNKGAVYLFNLDLDDLTLEPTYRKKIAHGTPAALSIGNDDAFGASVALNSTGSILAVGALLDNTGGTDRGSAFLIGLDPDDLTADPTYGYEINSSFPGFSLAINDYFGLGVALNGTGDILAVGAYGDDTGGTSRGAVYLFNLNTADLTQAPIYRYKLDDNHSEFSLVNSDCFGVALDLNDTGDILAVGAGGDTNNRGAVYLFNLNTADLTLDPTYQKKIAHGTAGISLNIGDWLGIGVALNGAGDILAAGVSDDDPAGGTNRGAVYLFNLDTGDLTQDPLSQYRLDDSHSGFSLADNEYFGVSVALNSAGDILAVGAHYDNTGGTVRGAVHLFNLNTEDLTPTWRYKLDDNHTGFALEDGDAFGRGVALNDSGNILAVGAEADNTGGTDRGAVYLFNLNTADLTQDPDYRYKLAHGSLGLSLTNSDLFGASVALNADGSILAVGAHMDDTGGTDRGAAYLFNLGNFEFADSQNLTVQVASDMIETLLSTGNNLTLQASNDIFVSDAITASNSWGDGGNLTLQAGRSLLINANITTDNGDLTLIANDLLANGVVDSLRDSGAAAITMAAGTSLNAGSGTVTIDLRAGTGKTYSTSGDITLRDITAGSLLVTNSGPTSGSDISSLGTLSITGNSSLTTSTGDISFGAGSAISKTSGGNASLTLQASNSILLNGALGNTISISSSSGALGVTLNSDSDASGAGAIRLDYTTITTNGGNLVMGGGADPSVTAAYGTSDDKKGVRVNVSTLTTGAGTVSIRGTGYSEASATNQGIYLYGGSTITSTSGTISLMGTGGAGTTDNYGIFLTGTDTKISSADGNITLTGTGNSDGSAGTNVGIRLESAAQIESTGTATITLTGTGGNGVSYNYGISLHDASTKISSVTGNILLTGVGGNGSGTANRGIYLTGGSQVVSTGTATITLDGTGGTGGTNSNQGIFLTGTDTKISSTNGNIALIGDGGGGSQGGHAGIRMESAAQIESTGTATITLTGTGGVGTSTNYGISLHDASTKISSVTGNILLTGVGGNGSSSDNYGLYLTGSAQIESTGTATITLDGTGGAGTSSLYGLYLTGTDTLISSVDGNISLTGTGGNGSSIDNRGIVLNSAAQILSTGTATITLDGTGGVGTNYTLGIYLTGASTLIQSANGNITLTGNGGGNNASSNNYGIMLDSTAQINSTGTANISLTGTGNVGTNDNYGVYMDNAAEINSTGTGSITLAGTAGAGTQYNWGIHLNGANTLIESASGDITLTGTGGNSSLSDNYGIILGNSMQISSTGAGSISLTGNGGDGTSYNIGLYMYNGAQVNATGAGAISLAGTAGAGTANNNGLHLTGANTKVSSQDGDITLTGTGGNGSSINNRGIIVESASQVLSAGAADISLTGTGGAGTQYNYGVYLNNGGLITSTGTGAISLTGTGGAGADNYDLASLNGSNIIGDALMTDNITLTADSYSLSNLQLRTAGQIIFAPRTASTTIGINGGAGTLQLGDSFLNLIDTATVTPSKVIFGDAASGSGAVTITGTWDISARLYDLEIAGGSITTGGITTDAGESLILRALSGSISQSAGTLTAGTLNLFSTGSDIGSSGSRIQTAVGTLTANTTGNVYLTESDAVTLGASSGISFSLLAGVSISTTGAVSATDLTLQTTANNGSITLGANLTGTGSLNLTAHGSGSISQNAGRVITSSLAAASDSGNIILNTTIEEASLVTGGDIFLSNNRALIVALGGITGQNVQLETTSGSLTLIGLISGATIALDSAGNILDGNGTLNNLASTAGGILQAGGYIGTKADPLDVYITGGALSIRALGQLSRISVDISGTVSPSNKLTLLNTPPGYVIFNGAVQIELNTQNGLQLLDFVFSNPEFQDRHLMIEALSLYPVDEALGFSFAKSKSNPLKYLVFKNDVLESYALNNQSSFWAPDSVLIWAYNPENNQTVPWAPEKADLIVKYADDMNGLLEWQK